MLTREGCAIRQQRLLTVMEQNQWDLFLTADPRTTYYLTGSLAPADAPVAFLLWAEGRSLLVTPGAKEGLADRILPLEMYSIERVVDYPERDLARMLRQFLTGKRLAVERRVVTGMMEQALPISARVEDATDAILRLRKKKEPDEVAEIQRALDLCEVAYAAARKTIAPGLREADVYAAMYEAVVKRAGTAVTFPGDFACGERCISGGGPPTERVILPGDLYILDLFPAPAFYSADTCRTFAAGAPSDVQQRAWEVVVEAVKIAEAAIRPGVGARDVYRLVKDYLDSQPVTEKSFRHHLGHGIGHRGHESPRIIPGSTDVFEAGDVFTLEPGVYSQALHGGIRLEDNYLVTETGIRNLFDYPREL
ncbi:MAG: Xaa-Pro peptidase family protein [Bryobacterales bacterium]|nr:Xaa-Pro peptidase family protein [Bryobacterales bacterium]